MTAAKLRELEAKATGGRWITVLQAWSNSIETDDESACLKNNEVAPEVRCIPDNELICYLRNHAQDFIKLMEAAEEAATALNMGLGQQEAEYEQAVTQAVKSRDMLTEALATFKEKS